MHCYLVNMQNNTKIQQKKPKMFFYWHVTIAKFKSDSATLCEENSARAAVPRPTGETQDGVESAEAPRGCAPQEIHT